MTNLLKMRIKLAKSILSLSYKTYNYRYYMNAYTHEQNIILVANIKFGSEEWVEY